MKKENMKSNTEANEDKTDKKIPCFQMECWRQKGRKELKDNKLQKPHRHTAF